MTSADTQVPAPIAKAASALGAGAGTSLLSTAMADPHSFLPHDYAGWAAAIASTLAALYTLHLMCEWYWKKFLRGWCLRHGLIKGRP